MEVATLIDHIAHHGRAMVSAVSVSDPDASVPTVSEWTVRDLVWHMGDVHRWATGIVSTARQSNWDAEPEEIVGEWPRDDDLSSWLQAGLDDLVETLLAAPDDLDCWTFKQARSPKHFWARRQAHEVAVHRADAEAVVGSVPEFAPEFAADGLDELLVATLPQPRRKIRRDQAVSVSFEPNDVAASWWCDIGPNGFATTSGRRDADCVVRGTAGQLYLFSWNRVAPDQLDVTGDASVLDVWRAVARV